MPKHVRKKAVTKPLRAHIGDAVRHNGPRPFAGFVTDIRTDITGRVWCGIAIAGYGEINFIAQDDVVVVQRGAMLEPFRQ